METIMSNLVFGQTKFLSFICVKVKKKFVEKEGGGSGGNSTDGVGGAKCYTSEGNPHLRRLDFGVTSINCNFTSF